MGERIVVRGLKTVRRAACLATATLLGASSALAGPPETMSAVSVHPTDPDFIAARYDEAGGGVFLSRDGGQSWTLLCDAAVGQDDASMWVVGGNGSVYTADFDQALRVDVDACTWNALGAFEDTTLADVIVDARDPQRLLGVTSRGGQPNGMYSLGPDGVAEPIGALEDDAQILRVRMVALPGGGHRIAQSLLRRTEEDGGSSFPPHVRYSDDGGLTWVEHRHDQRTLRIEAIDPTNPDRFFFSSFVDADSSQVMVSDDAGATLRTLAEIGPFGGLTVSPEGRLWVGSMADGLLGGPSDARELSVLDDTLRPRCVHFDPASERLYVCQLLDLAWIDGAGRTTPLLSFQTATTLHACPDVDVAAACERQLSSGYCGPTHFPDAPICRNAYPERYAEADAAPPGLPSADAGADPPREPPREPDPTGCHCRVGPTKRGHASWIFAAVATLGLIGRRRRDKQ